MLSREGFARLIGRLDDAELARFVADLWTARGWESVVNGRVVTATREAPVTERLTILVGRRRPAAAMAIDMVVLTRHGRRETELADDLGADLIDPDALYDLYAFGLEGEARQEILDARFGPAALRRAERPLPSRRLSGRSVGWALVLALAVVVAVVAVGAGIGDSPSIAPGPPSSAHTASTTPDVTGPLDDAPDISGGYLARPDEFIIAHTRALYRKSYTIEFVEIARFAGGKSTTRMTFRATTVTDRSVVVETRGPAVGPSGVYARPAERRELYRNGAIVEAVMRNGTTDYRRLTEHAWEHRMQALPHKGRLESHIFTESVVLRLRRDSWGNETSSYRFRSIAVNPDRFGAVEGVSDPDDVRLDLVVDDRGVIREATLKYRATRGGVALKVTRLIAYSDRGTTEVNRPDWYDRAIQQETSGGHRHA